MTLIDYLLSLASVGVLFVLGVVGVVAPRRLVWLNVNYLSMGLPERTRESFTRAGGIVCLLLALWLAWRFFGAAV